MRSPERQLAFTFEQLTDAPRGDLRSDKILPPRILSLSPCIHRHQQATPQKYSVHVSLLPDDMRALELTPLDLPIKNEGVTGYEIISWEADAFRHSWLCMSLEARAFYEFKIKPGDLGLLQSEEDAIRLLTGIRDGTFPAEPGHWLVAHLHAVQVPRIE